MFAKFAFDAFPLKFPTKFVAVILPATVKPVLLIVTTLATPPTPAVMFPLLVAILTLLLPLLMAAPDPGGDHCNIPFPSVVSKYPAIPPVIVTLLTGPKFANPLTFKLGTVTKLLALSYKNAELPPNTPLLLYCTEKLGPSGLPPALNGCPLA